MYIYLSFYISLIELLRNTAADPAKIKDVRMSGKVMNRIQN